MCTAWGSPNPKVQRGRRLGDRYVKHTTIERIQATETPTSQHSRTTHLGADVVLRRGLREALNVHGVLCDGRHAAAAPLAPFLAVLAAVLSTLASRAAPPVAVAAPAAAVGLATVLVPLAGGADAGDRCPLLEVELWVGLSWRRWRWKRRWRVGLE